MHVLDDARAHHQVTPTEVGKMNVCCQLCVGSYSVLPNRSYLLAVQYLPCSYAILWPAALLMAWISVPPSAINKKE